MFESSLVDDPGPILIYTLSLHDALPISSALIKQLLQVVLRSSAAAGFPRLEEPQRSSRDMRLYVRLNPNDRLLLRSEEHTSELQSRRALVCRLLLEKKNEVVKPMRISVR